MRTKKLLTLAVLCVTACGRPSEPGESALKNGGISSSTIGVQVSYRWENAKPIHVNGKPVLAHKYWSCVDTVTVTYPQSMRLATVIGGTMMVGQYNMRRALRLSSYDANFRRFVWAAGNQSICNDSAPLSRVVIAKDVWSLSGATLTTDDSVSLSYPAGRDTLPTPLDAPLAFSAAANLPRAMTNAANEFNEGVACTNGATTCFTVTPQRLNTAIAGVRDWEKSERTNSLYASNSLKLMPLENLLQPFMAPNRERQWGAPDTLYVLRRAGKFMQLLFPGLQSIPVADLSERDGTTPKYGDTQLHPDGAHRYGRDVDVSYITTGNGNAAKAPYHWERNFWFLYGVLQSTSVDMVLTAYKSTFVQMANNAYALGLINTHAVGRIASALMADSGLNHDQHMHIAVSNLLNDGITRRFGPTDDVYGCYLSLHSGSEDGAQNFCGSP